MAVFFAGPLIIIVLLIVLLSAALFVVPQQQAYINERFGKFLKVQFAGIHIRIPFVDRIAMKTNMRVNQLNVQLETKTLDNVFVTVVASTQFRVNPNDVATAYYELRDPAGQLRSYMEDALRSAIPALSLDDAFARKVALTSPVTLWAVLKSVAYAWQQQSLTDDAKQLFDLSRELYERFSTLGDYAIKLGTQITKTVSAYNKFASSLERRVLPTARKLQKIEPTKIIEEVPIIESDKGNVSELSAPEVVPADEGDTHLTASGDSLES